MLFHSFEGKMKFLTFCGFFEMLRHQRFFCNHWTEFNLAMLIFLFFDEDYAPEKIFGPICHFGPFWVIFQIFIFFLNFRFFFVFEIFDNIIAFSCNIHLKGNVKTFNLTTY